MRYLDPCSMRLFGNGEHGMHSEAFALCRYARPGFIALERHSGNILLVFTSCE